MPGTIQRSRPSMAENGYIKQEPAEVHLSPAVSAASRTLQAGQEHLSSPAVVKNTAATRTSAYHPGGPRQARSGAPSVETRPQPTLPDSLPAEDEEEDEGCVLMEVRPRIKLQDDMDSGLGQTPAGLSQSFLSNGTQFHGIGQAIGQKLKQINDTLGKLQSLGIQHVTSLPELVLVGDQSSGKSTLMSALAGLNLPHSDGTCTRCPIHIQLSSAVSWTCKISLQLDYSYPPAHGGGHKRNESRGVFPPWKKQTRVTQEFKTLNDKEESVEDVLRWAQLAILNPNRHHTEFIPQFPWEGGQRYQQERMRTEEVRTEAKFSPNTVALHISGPDLPDLSFYDLPGIFVTSQDGEDSNLVKMVQDLACEYITHEQAIILLALPMNNDVENSSAFGLVQRLHKVDRCVGVLTKADLLPRAAATKEGSYEHWLRVLEGKSHKVGLGYFITSRPDHPGGLDQQRAAEESFFNRQSGGDDLIVGWPRAFAKYEDRCGVGPLKHFLEQKLGEEFARSLPAVKHKLLKKLGEVEGRLMKLPEMPQNPEVEIRRGLDEFVRKVQDSLRSPSLQAAWGSQIASAFKDKILALKPRFVVKPPPLPRALGTVDSTGVIVINDAESTRGGSHAGNKRRAEGAPQTPSKRPTGANGVRANSTAPSLNTPHAQRVASFPASPSPARIKPDGTTSRTLEDIRDLIAKWRLPGKPGNIPDEVKEELCMDAVRPWKKPMDAFVDQTMNFLDRHLGSMLEESLANLNKRAIFKKAKERMRDFVRIHASSLSLQLQRIYELETLQLYTMDEDSCKRREEEELKVLARHRHFYRWQVAQGQDIKAPPAWETMTEEARDKEKAQMAKELAKLGPDSMALELSVAAYARGYFRTAAMRFIDNVCLHVISGLFPQVIEEIDTYLEKELQLDNSTDGDIIAELMKEDPRTSDLREKLKADKSKFEEAMESIGQIAQTDAAEDAASDEPSDVEFDDDGANSDESMADADMED